MNILDKMDSLKHTFTKTDYLIYLRLKKDIHSFSQQNIASLTRFTGCSQAALTRFAKRLGFNGFTEFQYQLSLDIKENEQTHKEKTPASYYGEVLLECEKTLSEKTLCQLSQTIEQAENIYLLGLSLSKIPCEYMETILHSKGYSHARAYEYEKLWHTRPQAGDVIFIFSVSSGEHFKKLLSTWKNKESDNPKIILVTMNPKHSLLKYSDEHILLPSLKSADNDSSLVNESMCFLLFADMLTKHIHSII